MWERKRWAKKVNRERKGRKREIIKVTGRQSRRGRHGEEMEGGRRGR